MKWKLNEPVLGDIIRVKAGSIYHYGIYLSDDEIVQFGAKPQLGLIVPDSSVRVISTDISNFLLGGFLEVAELSRKELKKRRSPEDTAIYAKSRLGEAGYDIFANNCEHFVYECAFGEAKSEQSDKLKNYFQNRI